jgi:putative flippase GtrA
VTPSRPGSRLGTLLDGVLRPARALLHEAAKFGVVGAVNVVIDVGIFNLFRFHLLPDKPITDKVISTSIAIVSSYFMNRHWTWRDRARTGIHRELPLFLALSGVGLGIALACLAFSHYGLGLTSEIADNISANVIGLGLGMFWRFWAFRKWVFLSPETGDDDAAEVVLRTSV